MNNQFIINLYFYKKSENPKAPRNFSVLQDELIEIKDIKDEDSVSEAIKSFDFRSKENIDSKNIVNNEEVDFNISDSDRNGLWFGKGIVNENHIDIIKIQDSKIEE